ncbi:tRNA-splicing endonuclease subunit Sen54, partial [Stegodyphus mimosarum]
MNSKIALCPEECIFLLENGFLEIKRNEMPMSTEEAYAVILKGRCEKYQVYSFLSQLGFLVVPHQTQLGVTTYEKRMNLDKLKLKKRKSSAKLPEEPKEKRLTFTGALVDNAETNKISHVPEQLEDSTASSDCQFVKANDEAVSSPVSENRASINNVESNQGISAVADEATEPSAKISLNVSTTSESSVVHDIGESISNDSAKKYPSPLNFEEQSCSVNIDITSSAHSKLDVDTAELSSQNTEISCETVEKSVDNHLASINVSSIDNSAMLQDFQNGTESSTSVEIQGGDDYADDSSEASSSLESVESDLDSRDPEIREHITISEKGDDDVTLIEVKKKETKPLAVIDLLSDDDEDETTAADENEESDDDIQVVKVCSGSSASIQTSSNRERKFYAFKQERKPLPESQSSKLSPCRITLQYPDYYKKDVVCVPRPPPHCLPFRVLPAKEAYVLDLRKECTQQSGGRLWNSYRDLQEYQHSRRQNRNSAQMHENRRFGNWQNRSPPRDHKRELNHIGPSNSPDRFRNSRDFSYGRQRNPEFNSFGSGRNSHHDHSPYSGNNSANLLISPRPHDINLRMQHSQFFQSMLANNNTLVNNFPPSLQNLSSLDTADFMSELQRTVYNAATNLASSMLSESHHQSSLPEYGTYRQERRNFYYDQNPPNALSRLSSSFVQEGLMHHGNEVQNWPSSIQNNRRFFRDNGPRNYSHRGRPFPCLYRSFTHKSSWNDIKAAVDGQNGGTDEGNSNDIEEVPIYENEVLWCRNICPLVRAGSKYTASEVMKMLGVTQMAKMLDKGNKNEKYFPATPSLEISFDVYLPGTNYRKTCPEIPKYRIIVVRSTDSIPKYSELVLLQRKWNDNASLQIAVVDNGDINFYSFNNICLPNMESSAPV